MLHMLRYARADRHGGGRDQHHQLRPDLGIHSPIDETIAEASDCIHAGNLSVNRHMNGTVVGV